jgi:hypothetical protein
MTRTITITITYTLDDPSATAETERADWLASNVEVADLIGSDTPFTLTAAVTEA